MAHKNLSEEDGHIQVILVYGAAVHLKVVRTHFPMLLIAVGKQPISKQKCYLIYLLNAAARSYRAAGVFTGSDSGAA